MGNANVLDKGYQQLEKYVKRLSYGKTFNANTVREKVTLSYSDQYGALISTAVRRGLIERIGETVSDNPYHNGGRVGVYTRR